MYSGKKFGALSSSVDPNKLAKTVEGVLKALGGVIAFWGVTAVAGDVNSLADQLSQMVTLGYAFWGVAETAFGLVRKIVVKAQEMIG